MCRLFAFRSVISSQVHHSLREADNALLHQSSVHPDGWGVAYYVAGSPHVIKSTATAIDCSLFEKVSGIVTSETVMAHIRKATQGELCLTNAHPFQYGRWIFSHNGNIENFAEIRPQLIEMIPPILRRFILGKTDSEVLFFLLLTHISHHVELHRQGVHLDILARAVRETVAKIVELVGPFHLDGDGPPTKTYLTFVLTDGATMIAHQGGKPLYYSTYKTRCSERDSCPHFAAECENKSETGYVNHLIFSSEPIHGENIWLPLTPGQIVGIGRNMRLRFFDSGVPESV